jgi:hypothetical protein
MLNKRRSNIVALYQEVSGALEDLATPKQNIKRKNQRWNKSTKGRHLDSIPRDSSSYWVIPSYNSVVENIRSLNPSPPIHNFVKTTKNSVSQKLHAENAIGQQTKRREQSAQQKKTNKGEVRIFMNLDEKESVAVTEDSEKRPRRRRPRVPPELEPHEKYQERESILCKFAEESKMTWKSILPMYQHFKQCMLPPDDNNFLETKDGDSNASRGNIMLAHVFLREICKMLTEKSLSKGLDELLFINFDIDFVGTLDIREFVLELACCNELNFSVEQMVSILFHIYGRVQNDDDSGSRLSIENSEKIRVISSELIASLIHRGTESARALVQTVERFLSALDADGDGTITWTEYISAVTEDHTILDSFRRAYSASRRENMLGVMMFSPLNRFLRRCNFNWLSLTKMWNNMNTTLSQYRVVGKKGGRSEGNSTSGSGDGNTNKSNVSVQMQDDTENKNIDYRQISRVLLTYQQFRDIIKPFFGKGKPGDASLISDLFDAAVTQDVQYMDKQGNAMKVADCYRFVIDVSASYEDSTPSMGTAIFQRARFYFLMLDLDRKYFIEILEIKSSKSVKFFFVYFFVGSN